MRQRLLLVLTLIGILVLLLVGSGSLALKSDRLRSLLPQTNTIRLGGPNSGPTTANQNLKVVSEESVTIDIVKKVTPAVVTIGITKNQPVFDVPTFDSPFGDFFQQAPRGSRQIKQDIGSGFIVKSDGLIITNKHVVADTQARYRVITVDNKSFDAKKIY